MYKIDYLHCSGCSSCFNICPNNAIQMKENDEGFLYPFINKHKCNNCGLCERVCPILKDIFNNEPLFYYAMQAYDENILYNSSSGGVFYYLSTHILNKGGYVCGASFENKELKHIIIDNKQDLPKLMGSKYVQSDIGNIYKQIKTILENGKLVFFSGTPCQVAGLKCFLNKDYNNLLTVDVICHGVPSPKVFKKYLDNYNITDEKIYFREKSNGWNQYNFLIKNKYGNIIKENFRQNTYIKGFLNNLYLRNSCSTCQYTKIQRCSDITIGDFWKVENMHENFKNDKGTSLVLINSKKGYDLFNEIKEYFLYTATTKENALKSNKSLSSPWEAHQNRKAFFKEFKRNSNISIVKLIEKYCLNIQKDKSKPLDLHQSYKKFEDHIQFFINKQKNFLNKLKLFIYLLKS